MGLRGDDGPIDRPRRNGRECKWTKSEWTNSDSKAMMTMNIAVALSLVPALIKKEAD